jgi:transcriptional regulator with XRE-family HTH domain
MPDKLTELLTIARERRELSGLLSAARLLRDRAGLTQQQLADVLNVSRGAVSRWEAGSREPRGPLLARYLGVLARLARQEAHG